MPTFIKHLFDPPDVVRGGDFALQMTGTKTQADCKKTCRHMVEQEVREGMENNPWEELAAQALRLKSQHLVLA